MVVECARPDRWRYAHGRKHGDRVRCRKQDIEAQTVVEISKVTRRLLRVVVVQCAAIIVVTVMVVHDHFDMLAEVLDESSLALLAVRDMHEVTLRSSDSLPRKQQH